MIDRIGKNISGAGIDPNITGRWFGVNHRVQETPDITRIVALDLTEESMGNAVGIGLADFCSKKLVNKMDPSISYLNSITSRNLPTVFIPIHFDTDQIMMRQVMESLGERVTAENVRLLWIRDTLSLKRIAVSEALIPELRENPQVDSIGELQSIRFNGDGMLDGLFDD